jgi:hypothetical protein
MSNDSWSTTLRKHFKPLDDKAWEEAKQKLDQQVTGTVVAKAAFGAWVDIGVGFPALLEIPHIAGLTHEQYQNDEWCPVGSTVSAHVTDFKDDLRQVRVQQVGSNRPGHGVCADSWYLMCSSLPDLNWARLRVFGSGHAEVFDCDGKTHRFTSKETAHLWLLEDEFQRLESFDAEDEAEHGIKFADITPPQAQDDSELRKLMLVKRSKA